MELLSDKEAKLHHTVRVVCGLLAQDGPCIAPRMLSEAQYRSELVACMLTSQVSSALAAAALRRLELAGLLRDSRWHASDQDFEVEVAHCLRASSKEGGAYRFPNAKAVQLAALRTVLQRRPIATFLRGNHDMFAVRRQLVEMLPGIGPKQASMFLRNIGATYSLAILDSHVLRFLHAIGIIGELKISLSSLSKYEVVELHAIRYAASCGQEVGYLDWAIWITMKALREMRK